MPVVVNNPAPVIADQGHTIGIIGRIQQQRRFAEGRRMFPGADARERLGPCEQDSPLVRGRELDRANAELESQKRQLKLAEDALSVFRQREDGAYSLALLRRRAQNDLETVQQILRSRGYFNGTAEVAPMLLEAGCRWVIIGPSERRQLFGETDEHNPFVPVEQMMPFIPFVRCRDVDEAIAKAAAESASGGLKRSGQ